MRIITLLWLSVMLGCSCHKEIKSDVANIPPPESAASCPAMDDTWTAACMQPDVLNALPNTCSVPQKGWLTEDNGALYGVTIKVPDVRCTFACYQEGYGETRCLRHGPWVLSSITDRVWYESHK